MGTETDKATDYTRIYTALGVEFGSTVGDERLASACPFCGGAKFYVNATTGKYKCHSENKCGESGNLTTFLRHYHERCLEATTDDHRRMLRAKRGWSLQTQNKFRLAWDAERKRWVFPALNAKGEVVNVQWYDPATGEKRFLPGLPLPLFGLDLLPSSPEERAKQTAIICEGLTDLIDVHRQLTEAKTRGRYALFAVPSANVWKEGWGRFLEDFPSARLCYDNDDAGRKGQQRAAKLIGEACPLIKLSLLNWPADYPEKCDLGDLVRGVELNGKRMRVSVAEFTRTNCVEVASGPKRLSFVRGTDVTPERAEWLWCDRLQRGVLASLSGQQGTGKSLLVKDIAARVTAGLPMPGASAPLLPPADVLYLTAEDPGYQVCDLVKLHGGDLSRLHVFDIATTDDPADLLDRLPEMEGWIHQTSARLVILDPLNSFCGGDISSDAKARRTLSGKLNALARKTGATLLGIRNWGKADVGTGSQKVLGAASLSDVSRCVMSTVAVPPKPKGGADQLRCWRLEFEKVSGAPPPPPLTYRMEDESTGDADRHLRRVVWLPTQSEFEGRRKPARAKGVKHARN